MRKHHGLLAVSWQLSCGNQVCLPILKTIGEDWDKRGPVLTTYVLEGNTTKGMGVKLVICREVSERLAVDVSVRLTETMSIPAVTELRT